jgi:hypothetical protein
MRAGPLSGGANALGLLSYRGNLAALRHNRMTLGFECSVQPGNGVAAWRVSEAGIRAGSPDRPLLRRLGGKNGGYGSTILRLAVVLSSRCP